MVDQPTRSAACIAEDPPDDPYPGVANAGAYPPGYYAFARLFVGGDAERSLVVLRVVAFLVCSALLALAGLLLKGADRWRSWWFLIIASTPVALFFFASNNPSGTTIAGCAAATAAAYATGGDITFRHRALALGVGAAGALIAGMSRADGWQFALLSIALGALASVRSVGRSARPVHLFPWAAMAAIPTTLFLASGKSATSDYAIPTSPESSGGSVGRLGLLLELPRLYVGELATNLGWLDTPMPAIVWALTALALGGLIALGVGDMTAFRALSLGMAASALMAVPFFMQLVVNEPVGEWVQPRYLLPLLLSTVIVLAVRPGATTSLQGSRIVIVSLLAVTAHTWALHRVIRRSVTGLDEGSLGLNNGAEWWWHIPFEPMTVWLAGTFSYAAVVAVLAWSLWRSEDGQQQSGPGRETSTEHEPTGEERSTEAGQPRPS